MMQRPATLNFYKQLRVLVERIGAQGSREFDASSKRPQAQGMSFVRRLVFGRDMCWYCCPMAVKCQREHQNTG